MVNGFGEAEKLKNLDGRKFWNSILGSHLKKMAKTQMTMMKIMMMMMMMRQIMMKIMTMMMTTMVKMMMRILNQMFDVANFRGPSTSVE